MSITTVRAGKNENVTWGEIFQWRTGLLIQPWTGLCHTCATLCGVVLTQVPGSLENEKANCHTFHLDSHKAWKAIRPPESAARDHNGLTFLEPQEVTSDTFVTQDPEPPTFQNLKQMRLDFNLM
jgi:hypothetical protein